MSDRASSPQPLVPFPTTQQAPIQVKEEESASLPSPTNTIKTEESRPLRLNSWRYKEEERRCSLEKDPHVEEVEPFRVLCRGCKKWIKLSMHTAYSASNWVSHRMRCTASPLGTTQLRRTPSKPNFSPTSKIAITERKSTLLRDPQVRECTAKHVLCGTCKSTVVLDGEVPYDLTKWKEHKVKCIPMTPAPITPRGEGASQRARAFPPPSSSSTRSHVSAGGSPRSPTPVDGGSSDRSTVMTVVADCSPTAVTVGVKRSREEEADAEEEREVAEDVRPKNRPRTERYEQSRLSEKEALDVFGWFMLPLQELARGFREGARSDSA